MREIAEVKFQHWTKDEISEVIQSWLWVWVELIAWQLSRLGRLNRIQRSWVQIPLRPTFSTSLLGKYHTYHKQDVLEGPQLTG